MKKLLVEFIGTFVLVFTAGNAMISMQPLAAMAIGSALMIAVYAGGPISGGHYNPAISLAVCRRGKLAKSALLPYIGAQILGAIVAALLVTVVQGGGMEAFARANVEAATRPGAMKAPGMISVFVAELIWTIVLTYVVLQVSTTKKAEGNSYFGLAVGFTYAAGVVSLGSVSGGVFNPAEFVGLCLLGIKSWTAIVTFWGAQFLGGFVVAELFKRTNPDEA